jgi:hypothetical protein
MSHRLKPDQLRRMAEIEDYLKIVDRLDHLVSELDASRAAPGRTVQNLCETIARESSRMRQRALSGNVGTVADIAGALSVMASRGGGLAMKLRGLTEGVASMRMQLDHALKVASTPAEGETDDSATSP